MSPRCPDRKSDDKKDEKDQDDTKKSNKPQSSDKPKQSSGTFVGQLNSSIELTATHHDFHDFMSSITGINWLLDFVNGSKSESVVI